MSTMMKLVIGISVSTLVTIVLIVLFKRLTAKVNIPIISPIVQEV